MPETAEDLFKEIYTRMGEKGLSDMQGKLGRYRHLLVREVEAAVKSGGAVVDEVDANVWPEPA